MDEIKEIFSGDVYAPFLTYCERHGYKTMLDLVRCPFHELSQVNDITPMLSSRIKTNFLLYFKKHPEALRGTKQPKPHAQRNAAADQALETQLEDYFKQNPDSLIHVSDLPKVLGGKVKRNEIIHVLERASWCKMVDNTTFFYASQS